MVACSTTGDRLHADPQQDPVPLRRAAGLCALDPARRVGERDWPRRCRAGCARRGLRAGQPLPEGCDLPADGRGVGRMAAPEAPVMSWGDWLTASAIGRCDA